MFKQRKKDQKRLPSCFGVKHVFTGNKKKCLCGGYYKENGRIFRDKGDRHVAGTTADFHYKASRLTKRAIKEEVRAQLRK